MIDLQNVTLLNDTNTIWIKNEAFRIQRSMNKIWHNNLNQRKQAFWNMLKNKNTRVIYVDWFYRDNFPASQRSKKIFIGKDEGISQTSPCGSRTQQGKIQRK